MDTQILQKTAQEMVAKGILAMDESSGTMKKRFDGVGVEDSLENRNGYRNMLVGADGLGKFVSGAILFDETIRQEEIVGALQKQGVLVGIKVDTGAKEMALFPGEKITEGLDGLRERLAEYKELGARFAKWRGVIGVGASDSCIEANAHALARYAALCQEQDIVPIVEPEVLMEGVHTIEECYETTAQTLRAVFANLQAMKVDVMGIVLKPNMVLPGSDCPVEVDGQQVAEMTVQCFKENVPSDVAGIAFLSGGQSDEDATKNLNDINKIGGPWRLTFSYGRGLQREPLKIWADGRDVGAAQEALLKRSEDNWKASNGEF